MKIMILWSDGLIYLLVLSLVAFLFQIRRNAIMRQRWRQVFGSRLGMVTFIILCAYVGVALLDSLHFRRALEQEPGPDSTVVYYDNRVISVLDVLLGNMSRDHERTYSAPLALKSFSKNNMKDELGNSIRDFPVLEHAGKHLEDKGEMWIDLFWQSLYGLLIGGLIASLLIGPQWLLFRNSHLAWHAAWITQGVIVSLGAWLIHVGNLYHLLGTDLAGNDVLYRSIKGIRTGVLLGSLATLVMLPIAVSLGIAAGYFKGWVDDLVQYLYTTLSSIPGVLLIAASVLLFQVYIDLNPDSFEVGLEKADAKFVALCLILGVTSWATLCRLIRAETLKISQLDYVQAAHAFGVSHMRIIIRHILPNVIHIILITFVLEFSALVLAEAVLSYIGVGIDPAMASWGNMINGARAELSREPVIWWTLTGAFFFMFTLVLSANLFSDLVQDAFDPRVEDQRVRKGGVPG
jgi:peptide/nickel transport system permease protein